MAALQGLTEERFLRLRIQVSERIGSRRFSHTLGVEEEIIRLGNVFLPADIARLRIAALLHDITKEWSPEEQLSYCRKHSLPLNELEIATPRVLHAKTGAHVAKTEFSAWVDPEILHAIEFHTMGGFGMTLFDELLYLSDYIEPTRTYPDCIALRRMFWDGIEKGIDKEIHLHNTIIFALKGTIAELTAKHIPVFPKTYEALSYLQEKVSENSKN